jgi:predicted transcriptional regulator
LYDDRKVAIGAYNKTGDGNHIAMLLSSNTALVEWGTKLCKSYRSHAQHVSELPSDTGQLPVEHSHYS